MRPADIAYGLLDQARLTIEAGEVHLHVVEAGRRHARHPAGPMPAAERWTFARACDRLRESLTPYIDPNLDRPASATNVVLNCLYMVEMVERHAARIDFGPYPAHRRDLNEAFGMLRSALGDALEIATELDEADR